MFTPKSFSLLFAPASQTFKELQSSLNKHVTKFLWRKIVHKKKSWWKHFFSLFQCVKSAHIQTHDVKFFRITEAHEKCMTISKLKLEKFIHSKCLNEWKWKWKWVYEGNYHAMFMLYTYIHTYICVCISRSFTWDGAIIMKFEKIKIKTL